MINIPEVGVFTSRDRV